MSLPLSRGLAGSTDKRSSDLKVHPAAAIGGASAAADFDDRSGTEWPSLSFKILNRRRPRWTGTGSKEIGSK